MPREFDPRFDPGAPASPTSGIFGLDDDAAGAAVHVLPVPFDATASYKKGAARGPEAVLAASRQVDLYDVVTGKPYEAGIWMAPIEERVAAWNEEATRAADEGDAARVNAIGDELNAFVYARVAESLDEGKLACVLGGDHSVSFGAIRAHAERHSGLGILHFDAHADLRVAYEGFTWSHASILHNVTSRIEGLGTIVQVGIRDLSEEEHAAIRASDGRIRTLFDHEWADACSSGDPLALVRRTLDALPQEVYVTFDVDGLDPTLCPGTGTPVPGGLTWHEAMLWLGQLARSGRRIVGLDLSEVSPGSSPETMKAPGDTIDAVVGARLLYRLIGFALRSRAT